MSPQETQVLQQFLDQLIKVKGISKDADAQAMIAQAVSRQPDAAYLLVQRALLLDQAVANAQGQIAQLQTEVAELRAAAAKPERSGFLDTSNAWGNSAVSRPAAAPVANFNNPPPAYAYPAPVQVMAPPQAGFFGGNTGSMLGTVAATAAGVAAGAFLFQGIGSLMGHYASGGMQGLDAGGSGDGAAHAAAASAGSSGDGLISNYFTDDSAAQSDAGGMDDLGSFDDGDTA